MRTISSKGHHDAWVTAWLERIAKGSESAERLALFDHALAALWRRALPTLGELTLSAVVDRGLREATGKFPQLLSVRIEASGMDFRLVGETGSGACGGELAAALRFLLVQLLSSLGALTGETLTPALHDALARAVPPRTAAAQARS
jgi:hypothetical protein